MSSSWRNKDEEPEDEENEEVVDNEVRPNNCQTFCLSPPSPRVIPGEFNTVVREKKTKESKSHMFASFFSSQQHSSPSGAPAAIVSFL